MSLSLLHPILFVIGFLAATVSTIAMSHARTADLRRVIAAGGPFVAALAAAIMGSRSIATAAAVLVVSAAGALTGSRIERARGPITLSPAATIAMTIASAVVAVGIYLSVPDTEVAVVTLGLLSALALTIWYAAATPSLTDALTIGAGVVALLVMALTLGAAGAFSWSSWWVAKAAALVVAIPLWALAVKTSGRGCPRPSSPPAHRS